MSLRLPPSWPKMGWVAKAAYLADTHQAKDYPDACRMLRDMRKPRPRPAPNPLPSQVIEKRWDLNY